MHSQLVGDTHSFSQAAFIIRLKRSVAISSVQLKVYNTRFLQPMTITSELTDVK